MSDDLLNVTNANNADGGKSDNLMPQREFGIYLREARQAAGLLTADDQSLLTFSS